MESPHQTLEKILFFLSGKSLGDSTIRRWTSAPIVEYVNSHLISSDQKTYRAKPCFSGDLNYDDSEMLNRQSIIFLMLASKLSFCPMFSNGQSQAKLSSEKEFEATYTFEIPTGEAEVTLKQFGEVVGKPVVFLMDHVKGVVLNEVEGEMTTEEAIEILVKDTGLNMIRDPSSGALVVNRNDYPNTGSTLVADSSQNQRELISTNPMTTDEKKEKKSRNFIQRLLGGTLAGLLAATPAQAQNEDSDIVELSPFTVVTEDDVEYTVANNISAARVNVATKNLPQSLVVFNQELLDDSNLVSLTNILDLDPSLTNGFSREGGVGQILARGMSGISLLYVDGFTTLGTNSIIPIAGVERIEILKGPNAVLYGETSPAGVINRITKRPSHDYSFGSIRGYVGQNNSNDILSRGLSVDFSTPLDLKFVPEEWGDFALRVELQHERRGTVKDTLPAEQLTAYYALNWRISDRTSLNFNGWYAEATADVQWETPITVLDGGLGPDGWATGTVHHGFFQADGSFFHFDDPRSVRHTAPGKLMGDDDARKTQDFVYMLDFQHQFNDVFSFRSQAKYEDFLIDRLETLPLAGDEWPINRSPDTGQLVVGYTNPQTGEFILGGRPGRSFGVERFGEPVTAVDWLIPRRPRLRDEDQRRFDLRNELLIQGNTGTFFHNLLLGQTLESFDSKRTRLEVRNPGQFPNPEDVINYPEDGKWEYVSVLDPVGGGPLNFPRSSNHFDQTGGVTVPRVDFAELNRHVADREVTAFYVNDLISGFDDRMFLNLGWRYQENKNNLSGSKATSDTMSIGALYHLNDDKSLSLYANGNETFQPVFAISDDGYDLPPITGQQFETGLKFDLGSHTKNPGLFSGSFTYYNIELINIPINVAENPDVDTILRPIGKGRKSEGLEFTFTSSPVEGLRLFGGVSYILNVFDPALESTTARSIGLGPEDIWPQNVARWTANLLARYQFLDGKLEGWFATYGLRYNSARNSELLTGGGINRNINTFYRVPAESVMNLGVGKQFKGERSTWTVSLFVDNFTDEEALGRMMPWKVSFDPGRTWRLQIKNNF